jgi:hypothetical protein
MQNRITPTVPKINLSDDKTKNNSEKNYKKLQQSISA